MTLCTLCDDPSIKFLLTLMRGMQLNFLLCIPEWALYSGPDNQRVVPFMPLTNARDRKSSLLVIPRLIFVLVSPLTSSRSIWKHSSFIVTCHLMYHTVLSLCAFILQGILYIMWGDFCKSNSTGWFILMKLFSLEVSEKISYGKKRGTFIIFIS